MTPDAKRFWLVWNPYGHAPTFMHATHLGALAEARRLSLHHRGERFFVLVAEKYVECVPTPQPVSTTLS